ncbi:MAG: FAD-dependent oxidoreductase, partial [Acidimicrobiia bacterium]|nr:FAD-dependent oxidoreductase [Acidimicrobiia bacterium]
MTFATPNSPRLLVIGGGPAGTSAATTAAARGARVTVVEKDVIGGAAHLWDCIPSKTMTASAVRIDSVRNAAKLGLVTEPGQMHTGNLSARIKAITGDINATLVDMLDSQGVDLVPGTGRVVDEHTAVAATGEGEQTIPFDTLLVSTGSAPRVP